MTKSALQIARAAYQPKLPKALKGAVKVKEGEPTQSVADQEAIQKLFPNTYGMPLIKFVEGEAKEYAPMNVGVILSGGQAPGGHNVISGLFDGIKKLLGREDQYELNQQFVGYSMVVTFVLDIVSGLFSISILHWILQFYTIFVVFEGARTLMKVNEEKLTRYTLIASVIIIVCPALIAAVFNELSVILN